MQNNSVFFYRTDNTHSILMPPHRGYDDCVIKPPYNFGIVQRLRATSERKCVRCSK